MGPSSPIALVALVAVAVVVLVDLGQRHVDANPYVHVNQNGVYIENPVQKARNKIHHMKQQLNPAYQVHHAQQQAKQNFYQNVPPARKTRNFYYKLKNLKNAVANLAKPN